jgi:hypothetical protein
MKQFYLLSISVLLLTANVQSQQVLRNEFYTLSSGSYERAATLGAGRLELMAAYHHSLHLQNGYSESVSNNLMFRAGFGITSNFDIKLVYQRVLPADMEKDLRRINIVSIAPKYSLFSGRFSVTYLCQ